MENLVAFRLVGDEADALHLTNVVESDDTDPGLWVSLLCLRDFIQDLGSISAPEHGEFPHSPVPAIVVFRFCFLVTGKEAADLRPLKGATMLACAALAPVATVAVDITEEAIAEN
ncbi:hypothetical protein BC332_05289 [Capsicum chinense]|nr:hypothetical protein BC332_05289 [Capsicum chinense]